MTASSAWTPLLIRKTLAITKRELCIETTLACGQSFRWKRVKMDENKEEPVFACVLGGHLIAVKQDNRTNSPTAGQVFFRTFNNNNKTKSNSMSSPSPGVDESSNRTCIDTLHSLLHSYFALDVPLDDLYSRWNNDSNFKNKAGNFRGVRMLE